MLGRSYTHSPASFKLNSARSLSTRYRRIFAGFPATMAFAGTSLVTVLPAPTIAFSPIVYVGKNRGTGAD